MCFKRKIMFYTSIHCAKSELLSSRVIKWHLWSVPFLILLCSHRMAPPPKKKGKDDRGKQAQGTRKDDTDLENEVHIGIYIGISNDL